jgi:hypothetical protein
VFTVGLGSERLARDIQVDRVSAPRTVLKDASVTTKSRSTARPAPRRNGCRTATR